MDLDFCLASLSSSEQGGFFEIAFSSGQPLNVLGLQLQFFPQEFWELQFQRLWKLTEKVTVPPSAFSLESYLRPA